MSRFESELLAVLRRIADALEDKAGDRTTFVEGKSLPQIMEDAALVSDPDDAVQYH